MKKRKITLFRSNDVTHTQQQRPELPMVTFTWHASKYKVQKFRQRYVLCTGLYFFLHGALRPQKP